MAKLFHMRLFKFINNLAFSSLILIGCGSDSGDSSPENPVPEYIDQTLQGKIGGQDWTFVTGRMVEPQEDETFGDPEAWAFRLLPHTKENICDDFILQSDDGLSAMLSIRSEIAKHEFGFGENSKTATLVDGNDEDGPLNYIVTTGFVELIDIQTATATGRMVAHYDDDTSVIGEFEVVRCCRIDTFTFEVCSE